MVERVDVDSANRSILPENKPGRLSSGSGELLVVLKNPIFQEKFIGVQTQPERNSVRTVEDEMEQKAKSKANGEMESEAAQRLRLPVGEAKKLGKQWGIKLREVKLEIVGGQLLENGSSQPISREQVALAKFIKVEQQAADYIEKKGKALEVLRKAEEIQRQVLKKIVNGAEARSEDPVLLAALSTWGRSPDSQGNFGENGQGFNAGVIHYFEYRSDPAKNGRFKKEADPVSIGGFIEYSRKMRALMENPDPATNPDVQSAAILKDSSGQHRIYILTKNGELVVGFRRAGEEGLIKVVTVMPGQDEKDFAKRVKDEKDGKIKGRLNQLGDEIKEIPLKVHENQDSDTEIRRVLPEEQVKYFEAMQDKHFNPEKAVGSLFTKVENLRELLTLAMKQRGNLDGDDREQLIRMGVSAESLLPQCRYLLVKTDGEVGIAKVTNLPEETAVRVVRTKPNTPCSLVVEGEDLPKVNFGTIIIGPNEKENPDDPEPSTSEMVWTVHPGLPVRPASEDIWSDGTVITIKDVVERLGSEVYLNVRKR